MMTKAITNIRTNTPIIMMKTKLALCVFIEPCWSPTLTEICLCVDEISTINSTDLSSFIGDTVGDEIEILCSVAFRADVAPVGAFEIIDGYKIVGAPVVGDRERLIVVDASVVGGRDGLIVEKFAVDV